MFEPRRLKLIAIATFLLGVTLGGAQTVLVSEDFVTTAAGVLPPTAVLKSSGGGAPVQTDGQSNAVLPMQGLQAQHLDAHLYSKETQSPGKPIAFVFIFTMPAQGGEALGVHWDEKIPWTPIRTRAFKLTGGKIYYGNRLDKKADDLDTGHAYTPDKPQGLMMIVDEEGRTRLYHQDGADRDPASPAWRDITPAADPIHILRFSFGDWMGANNFAPGPGTFKLDYLGAVREPKLPAAMTAKNEKSNAAPRGPIGYARDTAPQPAYELLAGERYEALVPDTLDLAERAAIGVHGLTASTDPHADGQIYGLSGVHDGKLALYHSYHDFNGGQSKYIEALPLLRNASGSGENLATDRTMFHAMLKMIGPEGIYTTPVQNMPWQFLIGINELSYMDPSARQIWNAWPEGRVLLALCAWHEYTRSDELKKEIERMVDGLAKTAIAAPEDSIYFPHRRFDDVVIDYDPPTGGGASCYESTLLQGLAVAYRQTGYEPAKALAEKLTRYMRGPAKMVKPDGTYYEGVHFHGTAFAMMGMLDLALATNDQELAEFTKKSYAWARTQGEPLIGWFPEGWPARHPMVETCQLADMVIWAAKLSASGVADHWEDVESYVRNHLQSAQTTESWWLERASGQGAGSQESAPTMLPAEEKDRTNKPYVTNEAAGYGRDTDLMSTDRVADRIRGTFAGMSMVNGQVGAGLFHCCVGNGNRAFYFAWRHIVDENNGELAVNLLLNRASKWADVDSYLPYAGKVVVTMKTPEKLRVRIPSWVKEGQVACKINDDQKECALEGRYLIVGDVQKGDVVTVEFPLERRSVKIKTFDHDFTVDVKGFNVVDIWPRDNAEKKVLFPYYTRQDYREDSPRMKQVVRYAPERELAY